MLKLSRLFNIIGCLKRKWQQQVLPAELFVDRCSVRPGTDELPTIDNIDLYMTKLHAMITDSPQEHSALASTVREIVSRISFDG